MPDWLDYVRRRLRLQGVRPEREAEIVEDLAGQLDEAYCEALRRGLEPAEAEAHAQRHVADWDVLSRQLQRSPRGKVPSLEIWQTRAEERPRKGGFSNMLTDFRSDIFYGVRMLVKSPGFTAVAVITLALGIGANTLIFSLVNGIMLRSLPYADPGTLVRIWESSPSRNWPTFAVSQPNFLDFRDQNGSFERFAANTGRPTILTGGDEPQRVLGIAVTMDFLPTLGVTPLLGRNFLPEEDRPGGNTSVAMLSHGLWQRRFGSDPNLIGKTIMLNETPHTVVGVLPASLRWGDMEVFVPLAPDPTRSRGDHRLSVIGRLKPGVTLAQATTDLETIAKRLEQQYPDSNGGWTVRLLSFYDWLIPEETRRALLVLLGAVGAVLLIACANVANLTLARATARRREVAIRVALGAGRARLVRQFLTESVLLALMGGVLGTALAFWGLDVVRAANPGSLPRMEDVAIDRTVLFFTMGLSLLTGILFGLAPALQATRTDLSETLKEGGRGSAGSARQGVRNALVVSEVALSLVLLVGAGLLVRSFLQLLNVEPGFQAQNLLTASLNLPKARYPGDKEYNAFYRQLLERLESLPGVKGAAIASGLPMDGGGTAMEVAIPGRPVPADGQQMSAQWRLVSPGFFRVMGIPLLQGRDLRPNETTGSNVVVNEEFARRYWPGEDAVGRQFHAWAEANNTVSIVGVVGNVRMFGLDAEILPMVYLNFEGSGWPMQLALRTEGDPTTQTAALRTVVREIDRNLPVAFIRPMDDLLGESLAPRRFNLLLLGVFAGMALVLAAVGLYGVLSYLVSQRAHEIGIRMALGAQPEQVFRLVVGRGLRLTAVGIVLGVAGALGLTRLMTTLLFNVKETDPATFVAVSGGLLAVAVLACYVPARRATRVNPIITLRYE